MNAPPHLITEIPGNAVPMPRRVQTMLAIRQADRSGLPGFAAALATNLRAELEIESRISTYEQQPHRKYQP